MSAISTILTRLRAAIWAIDVRDDIANAIEQCYSDVSNPTLQTEALEAALQNKIDEGEMAALTIGDHTITAAKLAQGVIDNTLATSGAAADAKKTGDEIAAVKADLGAQTGIIIMTKNGYIDTNGTPISLEPHYSSAGRMYAVIDCAPSDKFVINAYSNTSVARAWCFIDSANNAISMAEALADVTDLELTSPNNATKLIINDMRGGMSYKVGNNLATKADNCLSDDIKSALLACFEHVAWSGTGDRTYYNALKDALLPQNWDYEWSQDSGVLPEHMTADTYNFTTEIGALYVTGGVLDLEYTGNCILEIEIKTSNLRDNSPQLLIQNEIVSENVYRGIKVVLSTSLGTSSEHGMCASSVNGETALITRTNSYEYHTYRLTAINNFYSISIDGENIPITQNNNTSPYYARTGISCASYIAAYIRSIKFKRL